MSGTGETGMTGDMSMVHILSGRLDVIRTELINAALKAGISPSEVRLVAVSKTVDIPVIQAAYRLGATSFGESRVQEFLRKSAALPETTEWHFIGRLQTNKVRQLAGRRVLIHSLDRMELLEEMVRVSVKTGCRWEVLVEVNVSGETSKAGVSPQELGTLLRAASASGCVRIRGLMTVAPNDDQPEKARPFFRKLRELSVDMRSQKLDNVFMDFLSMGMSNDFAVAIEEGANLVRIGTAIFGDRP